MIVSVNNNQHELPEQTSLTQALKSLNIASQKGVAVAVNDQVVPKAQWETHFLRAADKLTIIKATQGG